MTARVERFLSRFLDAPAADAANGGLAAGRRGVGSVLPAHPRVLRAVAAGFALAATLIETGAGLPHGTSLMTAIVAAHYALILLFPFLPLISSFGLTAVYAAFCVACMQWLGPPAGYPSQYWGVWLALLYLGYRLHPAVGVVAAFMDCGFALALNGMMEGTVVGQLRPRLMMLSLVAYDSRRFRVIDFLIVMLAMVFLGRCMRWRDDAAAARLSAMEQNAHAARVNDRVAAMRRNEETALNIHGSVTEGLSAIRTAVGSCEKRAATAEDRELFHTLSGRIDESMGEARRIADHLNGHDTTRGMATAFADDVRDIVQGNDRSLAAAGFTGSSTVTMNSDEPLSDAACNEALSLLQEVYANILSHGAAPGAYRVTVTTGEGILTIDAWNTVGEQGRFVHKPQSGKGLGLHRRTVERLGGTVDAARHDDRWTVCAQIPLGTATRGDGETKESI